MVVGKANGKGPFPVAGSPFSVGIYGVQFLIDDFKSLNHRGHRGILRKFLFSARGTKDTKEHDRKSNKQLRFAFPLCAFVSSVVRSFRFFKPLVSADLRDPGNREPSIAF